MFNRIKHYLVSYNYKACAKNDEIESFCFIFMQLCIWNNETCVSIVCRPREAWQHQPDDAWKLFDFMR